MRTHWWVAAAVVSTSACLPQPGTCQGGATRENGLCDCPEGTQQVDNECVDLSDGGASSSRAALEATGATERGEGSASRRQDTSAPQRVLGAGTRRGEGPDTMSHAGLTLDGGSCADAARELMLVVPATH